VLFGISLVACEANSPGANLFPLSLPTPHPSRQIVSDTLHWKQLWLKSMRISYGDQPLIVKADNQVIIPVDNGSSGGLLVKLDPSTGKTIWAQEFNSPYRGDGAEVYSALADDKQLYLAMPYAVEAFSLENGHLLWTSADLPSHTSYALFPTERSDIIGVHGSSGYYFDTKTGNTSPASQYPELHEVVSASPAIDLKILMNKTIVSNLAVADGKVYAITSDPALVAYDRTDGSEVGRMQFDGEPFNTNNSNQYVLVATDSEMLVYLGDSYEMRAFSRK
ncbi:MAG TPA: PQQ-binding-like beta-propeller repeat protein, partial [Anaerolineae bacterium]|nr:PQQ-binding-like beta-propeller repeat protein [Anaerolineae bacterium]